MLLSSCRIKEITLRLTASEADAYDTVIGAVEGSRTESDIADWLRENTARVR